MPRILRPLLLMALLALPASAHAQADARTQAGQSAARFVADLSNQAIEALTGAGIPEAERRDRFRHLFLAAADVPVVGRRVLGRYWRVATPEQRDRFIHLFEEILVYTWATRFENTRGGVQLRIDQTSPYGDGGAKVDSTILRQNQEPVPVAWLLRREGGGWRITDLVVEGTSMTITYHDEYNAVIAQSGGSVTALNDALARKVAQLRQQAG